jgi:hypothetical protein
VLSWSSRLIVNARFVIALIFNYSTTENWIFIEQVEFHQNLTYEKGAAK